MAALANGGDLAAIRKLLNRTVGKPDSSLDPDRVELDALQLAGVFHRQRDADEVSRVFDL